MKIHGTAKGGVLSKKDFGVAFGADEPPESSNVCETNLAQIDHGVSPSDIQGVAVNAGSNLIDKTVTKVSLWIKYANGATDGTLYCRAWDSSGDIPSTVAANFGSIAGSEVTSSYVKHTFTIDSGTYTIAEGSQIGIEYDGTSGEIWLEGQNDGSDWGTWFEYDGSYSGSKGTNAPSFCYFGY